ncbi:hypothetical protein [Peribacillus deserti]|uniref:Uncharacterized protein n=1 Tax=Peribacillus deserti TaxID=673318 RepID=A0A2N5M2V4_9BACI|nr:hypothetical protein [Peribacillus deserti]PLT28655.1 hypothetical protein CUU66_17290 [Peribacillus deserti]
MIKLIWMNLLPVGVIHSLLFSLQYKSSNDFASFTQFAFTLLTPFILLGINYRIALRKTNSYFISNFFLVLIGSVLGVVLDSYEAFRSSDYESYAIALLVLKFNIIVSIIGSVICSIFLIVKNRKK